MINEILARSTLNKKDSEGYDLVEGKFLDFTFWNLIRKDGRLAWIDTKWSFQEELPIDYILVRNICGIFSYINNYSELGDKRGKIIALVMGCIFPSFTAHRVNSVHTKYEEAMEERILVRV